MVPAIYSASEERYSGGMKYRRCGRSGVMLPEVSLGLWHNFGADAPLSRSKALLHYAFDHGVTHFDLANNYGPPYGTAESTFGQVVQSSLRPYRDEMFISTKAGYDMWPGPYGNWGSRKYLIASLDQSLKRMSVEYVDLFYSHRYDPQTPLEETLQALVDIVRAGKALYVGISRWPLEAETYAFEYLRQRDVPCLIVQDKYNIFHRDPAENGTLQKAADSGVGFISFSPLAQGLLTDRYLDGIPTDSRMAKEKFLKAADRAAALTRITRLNEMAKARGITLASMALAWILTDRRVTSVIVGASSVDQLATNLQSVTVGSLTAEEMAQIDEICKG